MELDRFAAGRANVVARWRGSGDEPALLFNGHLDTVPVEREQWRHDPHAAVVEGDLLHGRGTVDMKGGVAALAMACATLARAGVRLRRDLIFAGTAGEEVDCCGSQRLAASDLGPVGALVVGEPTSLQVVTAHKGALWLGSSPAAGPPTDRCRNRAATRSPACAGSSSGCRRIGPHTGRIRCSDRRPSTWGPSRAGPRSTSWPTGVC